VIEHADPVSAWSSKRERLVATAEEEFVYDERQLLAGRRRRSDGRFTRYTYDSLNQLVRVEWRDATGTLVGEPWTADYDVLGRRVRFGRGKYQTELWWDGLRIAAEEELVVERGPDGSASTRRARLRIYGYPSLEALVPSGFVDYASRDAAPASGAVYQVFTDPTGLPLAIEDARGETVWWATGTHPYGDVEVHPSSRIDYAMRWPGHRLDATLGLFYNRFRDYDPTLARYLQTDPIGQRGGINVYAYCNNPLKSVDLLGLAGTHGQHTPNPAPDGDAASTTGHPHAEAPPPTWLAHMRDVAARFFAFPGDEHTSIRTEMRGEWDAAAYMAEHSRPGGRWAGYEMASGFAPGEGIDQIWVRTDADGEITHVLIVEAKGRNEHTGVAAHLGTTKTRGDQMSPEWVYKNALHAESDDNSSPAARRAAGAIVDGMENGPPPEVEGRVVTSGWSGGLTPLTQRPQANVPKTHKSGRYTGVATPQARAAWGV
jgi:RHS repeat-associated protein